jgi:hypothetical protein
VTVKALTVRQPWAWAIIHGGKDVENRSRNLAGSYRGPVAIHAGKHRPAGWTDIGFMRALRAVFHIDAPETTPLHRGAIIGVVDLVGVHHAGTGLTCDPWNLCSPWAQAGHRHLVLANPRPLATPIPCTGRRGLWNLPDETATALAAALGEVRT